MKQAAKKLTKNEVTRVFVVDDDTSLGALLRDSLNQNPDIVVAGTAASLTETITQLRTTPVDVVILDIEYSPAAGPAANAFARLDELLAISDPAKVLFYSMYP